MQLWEDKEIVNALNQILKDYDYLEYDEAFSKHGNALEVNVTCFDIERDFSVGNKIGDEICRRLGKATGRCFEATFVGKEFVLWTGFFIYEYKED